MIDVTFPHRMAKSLEPLRIFRIKIRKLIQFQKLKSWEHRVVFFCFLSFQSSSYVKIKPENWRGISGYINQPNFGRNLVFQLYIFARSFCFSQTLLAVTPHTPQQTTPLPVDSQSRGLKSYWMVVSYWGFQFHYSLIEFFPCSMLIACSVNSKKYCKMAVLLYSLLCMQ